MQTVTLISDASSDVMPGNTQTKFTNVFKRPIQLDGSSEVALLEIAYSQHIDMDIGTVVITEGVKSIEIPISASENMELDQFLNLLNLKIRKALNTSRLKRNTDDTEVKPAKKIVKKPASIKPPTSTDDKKAADAKTAVKPGAIKVFDESSLGERLEPNVTVAELIDTRSIPNLFIPVLFDGKKSEISLHQSEHFKTSFKGKIAAILNAEDSKLYVGRQKFTFTFPNLRLLDNIYVYCDFIEEQIVGDTLAPLLRIVTNPKTDSSYTALTFNPPHYVNTKYSTISAIAIDMRDHFGNPIRFTDPFSRVFIKLQFKKRL